jgi:hypothetical protein
VKADRRGRPDGIRAAFLIFATFGFEGIFIHGTKTSAKIKFTDTI